MADKSVYIIADALYAILTDTSLSRIASIWASINPMVADNISKYSVADIINLHVGQTDDQQTRQLLVDLHTHFELRIYDGEIMYLHECFEQDREIGWTEWLHIFEQALFAWRPRLLKMLLEVAFPFPEQRAEDIARIKQWTHYWLIDRFEDSCNLPLYLAQQSTLSNIDRARMLAFAAGPKISIMGRLIESKKILERAEELASQDYAVKWTWGLYWLKQKKYKKAQGFLEEAIRLQPQSVEPYIGMGDLYEDQENVEEAERWYLEAMKKPSSTVDAHIRLMNLYGGDEALFKSHGSDLQELLVRAIAIDPSARYRAYLTMASILLKNKRYEDAYSWCKLAISSDETRIDAHVQLGFAYMEQKKYQEAHEAFQHALRVAPELFDGYWGMAILCERQGHWADAVQWYTNALPYRREWEGILREKIGTMQWKLEHYREAEEELLRALNCEIEERSIQYILDTLEICAEEYREKLGKPDAARQIYERIRSIRGTLYEADYQNYLGNLDYYADNYLVAAEYYRKAIAADLQNPIYYSNLAYALEAFSASGGGIQALADAYAPLQEALKLSPKNNEYAKRIKAIELKQRLVKRAGEFVLELSAMPFSIDIELGLTLVQPFEANDNVPSNVQILVDALHTRFLEQYGIKIPRVSFSANPSLSNGGYTLRISGLPLIMGEVPEKRRFFIGSLHDLEALAIHADKEGYEPLTGMRGYWLAQEDWKSVEAAGLRLYQEMEYPLRHLEATLQGIHVTLIDHYHISELLEKDEREERACTSENLRRFLQVLRVLTSESIPFAPAMEQLTHAFLTCCETRRDLTALVEQLRQLPTLQVILPGNNMHYSFYQLEEHFERELAQSLTRFDDTPILIMEAARYQVFLDEVVHHIDGQQPAALLVMDAQLRPFIRVLLDPKLSWVPVLALNDLLPELRERGAAVIRMPRVSGEQLVKRMKNARPLSIQDSPDKRILLAKEQQDELDEKNAEEDSLTQNIVEIEVSLHPLWYGSATIQGDSTNLTHPETPIEQEIQETLEELQKGLFQEQGLILPAVHFKCDKNLKKHEMCLRIISPQTPYSKVFQIKEEANQPPEQLICEVKIPQLVAEISSRLRVWYKDMGKMFLCEDDVQFGLNLLDERYSALVKSTEQRFNLSLLTGILKEILNAGGNIRDLRTILEILVTIDGTISIDDRHLPVYPGITLLEALKGEAILMFLPRAARCYPTVARKSLKDLNPADYAHYVQMLLNGPSTDSHPHADATLR